MLEARQNSIENDYNKAKEAKENAETMEHEYEQKLSLAREESDRVIKSAVDIAKSRESEILQDAKEKADSIVKKAKSDIELEKRKYEEEIKREIADVSSVLAEKVLERELSDDDYKRFINSFLENIGDE